MNLGGGFYFIIYFFLFNRKFVRLGYMFYFFCLLGNLGMVLIGRFICVDCLGFIILIIRLVYGNGGIYMCFVFD